MVFMPIWTLIQEIHSISRQVVKCKDLKCGYLDRPNVGQNEHTAHTSLTYNPTRQQYVAILKDKFCIANLLLLMFLAYRHTSTTSFRNRCRYLVKWKSTMGHTNWIWTAVIQVWTVNHSNQIPFGYINNSIWIDSLNKAYVLYKSQMK